MCEYEREILAHWDKGASLAAIAAATGRTIGAVEHVVELYDDRPDPDARAKLVAANEGHLALLRRAQGRAAEAARMRKQLLDVGDIEALLEDRIESLVADLLPNAVKEANEMCVGSLAGERGQSLRVHIGSGSKRGWWKDYSGGTVAGRDGGDALWLVACVLFAGDMKNAIVWAKSWLGLDEMDPGRIEQHRIEAKGQRDARAAAAAEERARTLNSAKARWHQAAPLKIDDPVGQYLAGRGIDLSLLGKAPGALRFHPELQYGFPAAGEAPVRLPAMVAMVTALDGTHIATHRTWLDPVTFTKAGADLLGHDRKGRVNDPKKVMGSPLGGHIPIWKGEHSCPLRDIPAGTDVYLSEGIEDGLTAACADPSIRVICGIALGYFDQLQLPAQMGRLVILKQNDKPGSDADRMMRRAVAAHRAAGRRVMFVEVPKGVKDLNDLARAGMGEV